MPPTVSFFPSRRGFRFRATLWDTAQPAQASGQRHGLSGNGREARPHARADVHELALLELEMLELGARQLRPHVAARPGLEVDSDLEAEVHYALDLHLLGA